MHCMNEAGCVRWRKGVDGEIVFMVVNRAVPYEDICCVHRKCLPFHIVLCSLFRFVANHTVYFAFFRMLWLQAGRKFAWRQHKQQWRRVNVIQNGVIPNKRMTPASRQGLYKELVLKRGYFWRMDVVWVIRKPYIANYAATNSTNTGLSPRSPLSESHVTSCYVTSPYVVIWHHVTLVRWYAGKLVHWYVVTLLHWYVGRLIGW